MSNALPHWALALLSALGISTASGHSLHQAPETEPYPVVEEKENWLLLPLIALIILAALLALIFRACSDKKKLNRQRWLPKRLPVNLRNYN